MCFRSWCRYTIDSEHPCEQGRPSFWRDGYWRSMITLDAPLPDPDVRERISLNALCLTNWWFCSTNDLLQIPQNSGPPPVEAVLDCISTGFFCPPFLDCPVLVCEVFLDRESPPLELLCSQFVSSGRSVLAVEEVGFGTNRSLLTTSLSVSCNRSLPCSSRSTWILSRCTCSRASSSSILSSSFWRNSRALSESMLAARSTEEDRKS